MFKINPHEQVTLSSGVVNTALLPFGVMATSYHEVAEGISNTVVAVTGNDGQEYFLKFYKRTHRRTSISAEISLVQALLARSLPVPPYVFPEAQDPVTAYHDGDNRYFTTLTKKIAGIHPTHYSTHLAAELGSIHAGVHNAAPAMQQIEAFDPRAIYNFFTPHPDSTEAAIDIKIHALLDDLTDVWPQLPAGIVPMDIKHDNVLTINDKVTGLIDFADTMYAPFVFCLANALWDVLEVSDDINIAATYVRAYQKIRPLSDLERKHLQTIVLIRGWITLHGYLLTNQQTAAQKQSTMLRNYLATPSLL